MWKTESSQTTSASPAAVWAILQDAEGWSSWNPGISSARLEGPFQNGTVGRTKPVRGPEGKFTIREVQDDAFFVNEASLPAGKMRFFHRIDPADGGQSRVTMGCEIEGPLSPLYGILFGRNIQGYMPDAVKNLVARAEGAAPAAQP
jgi:hypothetical protein